MYTQHIINQLTIVLNDALSLQCKDEAACIRNCICDIMKIQQRHIPTVPITILPNNYQPNGGNNVVNKPK